MMWSVDDGFICVPSIDEVVMMMRNFVPELRNPYCLVLYHRQYKIITLNDIRESLSLQGRDSLWDWITIELEDIQSN